MDQQEREIIDRISRLRPRPKREHLVMLWWAIEHLRPEIERLIVCFYGQKNSSPLLTDLLLSPSLRKFLASHCRNDRGSPMAILAMRLRMMQVAY